MDEQSEAAFKRFEELLGEAGMPVWAAWREVTQAEEELLNGSTEEILRRAYHLLQEKYGRFQRGA